jgi:hypothetical protein
MGVAVLTMFVSSLALPLVSAHVAADADVDCRTEIASTAGAALQHLDEAAPGGAAGHCALCHWLRAIRGASAGTAFAPAEKPVALAQYRNAAVRRLGRAAVPSLPSRAPPPVA